jgi:hypothetical protein
MVSRSRASKATEDNDPATSRPEASPALVRWKDLLPISDNDNGKLRRERFSADIGNVVKQA